jgi:hypothetical protein
MEIVIHCLHQTFNRAILGAHPGTLAHSDHAPYFPFPLCSHYIIKVYIALTNEN